MVPRAQLQYVSWINPLLVLVFLFVNSKNIEYGLSYSLKSL